MQWLMGYNKQMTIVETITNMEKIINVTIWGIIYGTGSPYFVYH